MLIHKYNQRDLSILSLDDNNSTLRPNFDKLLMGLWDEAMSKGVFRYKLEENSLPFKRLSGRFNYIAQLNPDRAEKRRKAQEIRSQLQPFNPDQFNFNKVGKDEVLLRLDPYWSTCTSSEAEHLLLVNVSPMEYGHVLLTPYRNQNRAQRITREGLRLALELILLSNSKDIRLGFNSLCGFASVNHEHWHAYYLSHRLFVEHASLKMIKANCHVFEDIHFPPGFCFILKDIKDFQGILDDVMKLFTYMFENDLAHNVYVTRGSTKNLENHFDSIRIFIWARISSFGAKECEAFNPAICELGGHFSIKSEATYSILSEEYILDELHAICDEPFQKVKEWIVSQY